MFRVQSPGTGNVYRLSIAGLLLLSLAALAITIWTMVDFSRQQDVVEGLIRNLPIDSAETAQGLAIHLEWRFRLSILVVLNLIATGFALLLLSRAYRSSQESLRNIKALAADILSSMDQAVITTNDEGVVTSINDRATELLDTNNNCLDQHVSVLSTELALDQFMCEWNPDAAVPLTRDFHSSANGKILRASCNTLSNFSGKAIGRVLQLRDVTDRVLMEERMRRMERYMGLGSLAVGLHHEIRNPLAALSLHVQLLEEKLEESQVSDELQTMLSVIKSEMARIGGVLEGFRDFASMDNLKCEEVDIAKLVQRQVDLALPQARRQGITVRCEISDSPLPKLMGDLIRLEQVLLNLLVNAMQAMPHGGELVITLFATSDAIQIEISDTGNGIPENLHDRVFDAYFSTKSEGTGLGLAICDKIVQQHNGNLDFCSSKDGTTFVMSLPIQHTSTLAE
ncbi:two-component system sensor histidine kinase NtrB [Blastopirellula marina]|uniref:histidine kinase n=1 Tax=Blastopirellula marina TaxID=124 RepID=A0A2S8F9T2_9BACT|nr:ATP-binding protein [Blastopirellula marina]PQO28901.1 PAS domain-containing sensor histidine kinase [Blastopirellula marina]PTL42174.1 GHKL domain-containing protein [Blastopirellula marina]